MSDNENTRPEAENKTNEQQTNEQSATRFVLTTEDEVDQLVSNAQAETTTTSQARVFIPSRATAKTLVQAGHVGLYEFIA